MDEFQVPINLNYQTEFGVSSYQKMTKKLEIVISLSWTIRTSVLLEHKDPPPEVGRSFLGSASFQVGELLKSKEQLLSLSLRTSDGGKVVGTIEVSLVKMGEIEDGDTDHITTVVQGQKCALAYECAAPDSVSGKDSLPLLNAVLKNPVCKLYRFPTSDNKWMRIREQMSESILSFHIPKELISLHIKEDLCRNQELKELGDLSPHWDNLRKNVLTHCDQMVTMYQDILTELSKETGSSFKSSSNKGEKTLEFVPINLHLQRMQVQSPHLKELSQSGRPTHISWLSIGQHNFIHKPIKET
ncbi:type II inositol-3,4-bisphosphate 4-phosphatase-like protein [Cricetulus griseus]|uniref:Type II inositol-3,4-bisphosphate 4-phosphatase-like protein n=1 Tax=Cricetulus griseus TaxID=10029 RepID=A0A061I748_CRIGR|nr:type II inositol-3,4-bisphosphate 4-phosphatase-like protein [Cricetulus griseus]